jgi:general stress protein 26
MPSDSEIKAKFWKHLKSDMTIMLGIEGSGEAKPMTAQLDGDEESGPIWFFTAKDTDLVRQIGAGAPGEAYFAAKGHDLFASVAGDLSLSNDRAVIDRLWSPFIAAWFEGGKEDPNLQLVRFDPHHAHIWLNENSLFSGVKLLLGSDPKKDYKDKVADVPLS